MRHACWLPHLHWIDITQTGASGGAASRSAEPADPGAGAGKTHARRFTKDPTSTTAQTSADSTNRPGRRPRSTSRPTRHHPPHEQSAQTAARGHRHSSQPRRRHERTQPGRSSKPGHGKGAHSASLGHHLGLIARPTLFQGSWGCPVHRMSSDHQHRKTFCVSVCGVGTRQQAGLPRRPTTTLHPSPRLRPRRATSTMTAS